MLLWIPASNSNTTSASIVPEMDVHDTDTFQVFSPVHLANALPVYPCSQELLHTAPTAAGRMQLPHPLMVLDVTPGGMVQPVPECSSGAGSR
jgi:hypothetical protein